MAHKKIGGWIIPGKLFAQIKVANELWYYSRRDESKERQYHLLFVGWYQIGDVGKLFTVNFLWLSIQIGAAV